MPPNGILNFSNTCYLNTALQCLGSSDLLREHMLALDVCKTSLTWRVCNMLDKMYGSAKGVVRPMRLLESLETKLGGMMNVREQNDVHEFMTMLMGKIISEVGVRVPGAETPATVAPDSDLYAVMSSKCDVAWRNSHKLEFSGLVDLTHGQSVTQIKCGNCGKLFHNYVPFLMLELEPSSQDVVGCLQDSMKDTTTDDWKCSECGVTKQSVMSNVYWKFPRVLMICIKRFQYTGRGVTKNRVLVDVPGELDLSGCALKKGGPTRYSLRGVANHVGSPTNGHYYASLPDKNDWLVIDDDTVRSVSLNSHRDAYVLVYDSV